MLELIPKSWYSWDFRVLENGNELTRIDRHRFGERGSFTLGEDVYDVRRTSVLRGTFVLERSGTVLAEAAKPSFLLRRFDVRVGYHRFVLKAASPLRREFTLLRGSVPVGTVRRISWYRRTATAEFAHGIPRDAQLFVVFLVLVLWKRAAAAAAS